MGQKECSTAEVELPKKKKKRTFPVSSSPVLSGSSSLSFSFSSLPRNPTNPKRPNNPPVPVTIFVLSLGFTASFPVPRFFQYFLPLNPPSISPAPITSRQAGTLAPLLLQPPLGSPDAFRRILASFRDLGSSRSFRHRQMLGSVACELVKGLPGDVFVEEILPSVVDIAKDPVPNVRIKAVEALLEARSHLPAGTAAMATVHSALHRLIADEDVDVAAMAAASGCGTAQESALQSLEVEYVAILSRDGNENVDVATLSRDEDIDARKVSSSPQCSDEFQTNETSDEKLLHMLDSFEEVSLEESKT